VARLRELLQQPAFRGDGWRVLGFVSGLNALLFALFFAAATPGYETNDDLGMQLIASGFYTGQPSEYLIFTNVLIGWILRCLYHLRDGHNWYFVYLVAVHYVSLTALAFVVLSRRRNWSFVLLYVGFFLMVEARILLQLQFTTTAFLTGAAGVLLLVDGLEPGRPARWPRIVAGVTLITLMGMIREHVPLFLAMVAFPFLVERFGFGGWRRLSGAALVCGALFLAMHGINRWYYERDPAWSEFLEYHRLRAQVIETPLTRFVRRAAQAVGWSTNDAQMFVHYYFSEPEVYGDISTMRRLVETAQGSVEAESIVSRFSVRWLYLPKALGLYSDSGIALNLALLSGIWCLFAAGPGRNRYFITLVAMYGVFVLLAFYLQETARLPPRVSYNMPLFMLTMCLYWAAGFHKTQAACRVKDAFSSPFSALRWLSIFAFAWVILYASFLFSLGEILWYANAQHRDLKGISRRIFEPVKALNSDGTKPLLIPMPVNSILEQCLTYRHSASLAPFYLVPYGWPTHSPLFRQILERHRLHPYSLSLVDRKDVFFLMEQTWLEPLRIFYREHYGLDIRFEMVLNTDAMPQYRNCRLYLYQAHSVGGEPTNRTTR